jgi:hypothetical protein
MLISYYVCIYINEQAMELYRVCHEKHISSGWTHLSSEEGIEYIYASFARVLSWTGVGTSFVEIHGH